jgi:hypothetical protein
MEIQRPLLFDGNPNSPMADASAIHVTVALPDSPGLDFPAIPQIPGGTQYMIDRSETLSLAFQQTSAPVTLLMQPGQYLTNLAVATWFSVYGNNDVDIFNAEDGPIFSVSDGGLVLKGMTFSQNSEQFPVIDISGGVVIVDACTFFTSGPAAITTRGNGFLFILNATVNGNRSVLTCAGNVVTVAQACAFVAARADAVVLSDNTATSLMRCEISQAAQAAISTSGASRLKVAFSKLSQSAIGLSSKSSADFQELYQTEFSEIAQSCIVATGRTVTTVTEAAFGQCAGPVISLGEGAGLRLFASTFQARATQLFTLAGKSIIECFDNQLTGSISVAGEARLTLLRGSFQGSTITASEKATLEMEGIVFGEVDQRVLSVTDNANLTLYGSNCNRAGGIRLRTAGKLSVTGLVMAECKSGLDVGGARKLTIDRSHFTKSQGFGVYASSCEASFTECAFDECVFSGLEIENSKVAMKQCKLTSNRGGGIGIRKTSLVSASSCCLSGNQTFAVLVDEGTTFRAEQCELMGNARIVVTNGKMTLDNTTITACREVAVQLDGNKSLMLLKSAQFISNATAFIATGGARVKMEESIFNGNGLHFEANHGAKIFAVGSNFGNSIDGIGIVMQPDAVLYMERCTIGRESRYGLVTATDVTITKSQITDCGIAGIVFLKGAKGKVSECAIEKNKRDGLRIIGGSPEIKDCRIKENAQFGIVKAKECVDADVRGNAVEGNAAGNIVPGEFQA